MKCTWYILPALPEKLDPPELTDGVMTTTEFLELKPDLILFDGRPQGSTVRAFSDLGGTVNLLPGVLATGRRDRSSGLENGSEISVRNPLL